MSAAAAAHEPELPDGGLVTVHLLELPIPVHARAQEHGEALRREFRLIGERLHDDPAAADGVPARLTELVAALGARYGGFTVEQEELVERAIADGVPSIDLRFRVPPSAAQASLELGAMLAEADSYCAAGRHLLTLEATPELKVYRKWYLDEFVRQIAGEEPRPWPAVLAGRAGVQAGGSASAPASGSAR